MRIESLGGTWQFRQVGAVQRGQAGASELPLRLPDWSQAQVPGGVHTDLLALGRIEDPFVEDNEKSVAWVAESDWEYRRTFTVEASLLDEEKVFLVCDGLDTLATLTLNGRQLASTDNMFRQYYWEVKSLLRSGDNELLISFASPVRFCMEMQTVRPLPGVTAAIPGGPHLRKAPCQFGWDWGPMLPPIGIWKDIRLEGCAVARLDDVHLRQSHAAGSVTISADVTVERWSAAPLKATLRVTAPDGGVQEQTAEVPEGSQDVRLSMEVPEAELWWPNGYGDQPLYGVEVVLAAAGEAGRAAAGPLDRRGNQLGLRTIELRQKPDRWGRSFEFIVNGVPIFAKGSNWIPADSFPTRISDAHLEGLIRSAAKSHQNMLRVWGGGFYEEERFYDLCDRYGILVWQEFIFACSIYPLDLPAFVDNLHVESVQNMRRLRHRASLALWCGNNEMEQGWVSWGWDKPELQELRAAYDRYFHHTLPAWVAQEDPDHAYWPSSPSSDVPFEDPNGEVQGDSHYWEVWHGRKPFTAYRSTFPRFQSEFGFQSLPPLPTVAAYASRADWNMTSYIMEHHQRSGSGNGLMMAQMTDTFRMPKDFPSLVYLSMLLQAEGIRYGVEHWRRNRPRVMGTLIWQLNDCWPVASWASLDYFGRWKALHYAARRFYAPVLLSVLDEGSSMSIHVTNDLRERWQGLARWSLQTIGGEVLAQAEEAVDAAPLADTEVRVLEFGDQVRPDPPAELVQGNAHQVIFVCELVKGSETLAARVATFAPNKHLALVDPGLAVSLRAVPEGLAIDVSARSLARFIELELPGATPELIFSDNYFDVPAARSVSVTCPLPAGWTLEGARAALRVRSLYNSFA